MSSSRSSLLKVTSSFNLSFSFISIDTLCSFFGYSIFDTTLGIDFFMSLALWSSETCYTTTSYFSFSTFTAYFASSSSS
jgi:hypothetical protein